MVAQISWIKTIQIFDLMFPDYCQFKPNEPELPESIEEKRDQYISVFDDNRVRLTREGKISDFKNRFHEEDLISFAIVNNILIEKYIWGDWLLELEEDEIIEKVFGVDLIDFNLTGKVIMIHGESYPRISKDYEKCDYKDRNPYLIRANSFLQDIDDFPVTLFDQDVIFINPASGQIIIFHHEGAKFVIQGKVLSDEYWLNEQ